MTVPLALNVSSAWGMRHVLTVSLMIYIAVAVSLIGAQRTSGVVGVVGLAADRVAEREGTGRVVARAVRGRELAREQRCVRGERPVGSRVDLVVDARVAGECVEVGRRRDRIGGSSSSRIHHTQILPRGTRIINNGIDNNQLKRISWTWKGYDYEQLIAFPYHFS